MRFEALHGRVGDDAEREQTSYRQLLGSMHLL